MDELLWGNTYSVLKNTVTVLVMTGYYQANAVSSFLQAVQHYDIILHANKMYRR